MLLTSHYMRDVEALCDRGAGHHAREARLRRPARRDHRAVRPVEAGQAAVRRTTAPDDLARFGEVARREGPVADLKVERARVAEVLAAILDRYTVVDVSVQDPPLEQVIARVFEEAQTRS